MNPLAKQFFLENPEAKYFYYNGNIRVPNPRLRNDPHYKPDPWPGSHEMHNLPAGADC